ncbi:MAG: PepSY-like domain-containing protein [Bacteroidales bacterium]
MKITLLLLVTFLSFNMVYSQKINESQVPFPVKAKFQSLHPTIKDVKWIKSKTGEYEAEFKQDKVEYGATLDSLGNLKETEKEMQVSELSKEIHNYVAKNYPGYKITEASQITYADGKPMYEAEITRGTDKFDLLFDNTFKFVKKGHF